jgi:cation transport ATPase
MGLVDQLTNKVSYALHEATYDPNAEKYAKAQEAAKQKALDDAKKSAEAKKAAEEKAAADAKAAAEKAEAEKKEKERENFEIGRMVGRVFGTAGTILGVFLLIVLGVYGASLATNLNIYRNVWYRILYMIYGFLGFFLVIPYSLLYRWWWLGKRPRFYALIPLIPYHLDNRWTQTLFSWLSFKPDDQIAALKEWEQERDAL